jgi:hypothetical protein
MSIGKHTTALLTAGVAVALIAIPTAASAAKAPRYSGTLTATPNVLHAGDFFDVTGCGYDTALGNVKISFTGGGWGSPLDSNGCFTITGIPALSGDTLPAGTYEVRATQYVHNKWTETGDTAVTVVQ